LAYADLHRLQFDLETTSLDPAHGRIFMVAIHDSQGFSAVLEAPAPADEKALIIELCRLIRQRDPDVIENHNLFGFDLPFLEKRAQTLGVALEMARPPGPSKLERFEEPLAYRRGKRVRYSLAGRELVDTLDAVLRHDFSARDMPGHGLKAAARYFGVAAPQRTYIAGAKVYETYRRAPETVRRYALDDVLEVDGLSQRLMGAAFALAGMAPRPYSRVASAGPAMGILEPLLVRAYLRSGEALPCYPKGDHDELGPHSGGATILYAEGLARQVVKADIASMYPSIMRTYRIGPRSDRLGVLLFVVSRLTDLRLGHKQALKSAAPETAEAYHHLAMHSAMKILINSGYGYMGAGAMALFADRLAADEITGRGREILGQVAQTLKERGMLLLEADTDGIFFAAPSGWDETQERALVAEVAQTLPEGLKLEYEGRYQTMLSHEVKNYALLTYEGRLIVRGGAMHSSRAEPFGVKFLEKALRYTLTGDIPGLRQLYLDTVAALRERRLDPGEVAIVARLAKSPQEYLKSRSRLREAAYEALLATGQSEWRVGERVRFYRGANSTSVKLPEKDDDDENTTPDPTQSAAEEDAATQEDDTAEAFYEPEIEDQRSKIENHNSEYRKLDRTQPSIQAETASESLRPVKEPAVALPRNGTPNKNLPGYDVEHYMRVFHVTYVSRLRKAFSPEDFEQLFRPDGQLGLFDRPIHQITPKWLGQ
jgi:DNA polymerase elongation subunit (family B)